MTARKLGGLLLIAIGAGMLSIYAAVKFQLPLLRL